MKAIKYVLRVTESFLHETRGWTTPIEEIWVELPDGNSFCINSKKGVFFSEGPRIVLEKDKHHNIELGEKDVEAVVAFLLARRRIETLFGNDPRTINGV